MDSENESKEEESIARHCAHCLQLCGLPAKLCGGCKKRAYCSKECQRADWSRKGNGQGHINWCRVHECGEEDVDWEVVPIPNKGLGIRAKKMIPSGLKIIVEPAFSSPRDHLGIKDLGEGLGPVAVSPSTLKFIGNRFLGENMEGQMAVALRIARVNHSCKPNAATIYDETARVAILFALDNIEPGEEISICYYSPFFKLESNQVIPDINPEWSLEEELNFVKNRMLFITYGITCSPDCSCYDPVIRSLIQEGRRLHDTVTTLARQHNIKEALAVGEKLLDVHRRLNVSWIYRGYTHFLLFQMGIGRSEMIPKAMEHIRSAVELFKKICPYSEKLTKKFEKLLVHPELDRNYRAIDKMTDEASGVGL